MRRAPRLRRVLALLALALGCGGGGGGGDDRSEITVDNAEALAGQAVLALLWTAELGAFGEDAGDSAQAEAAAAGGGISLQAVVGPITEPCEDGNGTRTITADLQNPPPLSSGDTVNAIFADCELETGEVVDGNFDFTVRLVAGDLDGELFRIEMSTRFEAFALTQEDTLVFDGLANLTVDTRDPPLSESTLSGNDLVILGQDGGVELLLEGFSTGASVDIVNEEHDEIVAGNGTVTGLLVGDPEDTEIGRVSYQSETPFERSGSVNPTEGELVVSGANDATIRVIAAGATATLEIDLDGDGTVDATQTPTWDELLSLE